MITLLQKKGRDPDLIKNWRPVSLTNVDYKILTKSLAMRTEEIMPKIIHENQGGFIKGRYIAENIRLIQDVMDKMKHVQKQDFYYYSISKKLSIALSGNIYIEF